MDGPMGIDSEMVRRLEANVARCVIGKPEVVRLAVIGLLARGHLLIEDVPGVGKTTLAAALARSIGGRFARIQFTADMLPSDVIGVSVWDAARGEFAFKEGRSEEHTSELQSLRHLVCRLLLEKK